MKQTIKHMLNAINDIDTDKIDDKTMKSLKLMSNMRHFPKEVIKAATNKLNVITAKVKAEKKKLKEQAKTVNMQAVFIAKPGENTSWAEQLREQLYKVRESRKKKDDEQPEPERAPGDFEEKDLT